MIRCSPCVLALCGCVLPSYDSTGLEISWRFVERRDLPGGAQGETETEGETEGEGTPARVRTCRGAGVERVIFEIADSDDASRRETFDFACNDGFLTEQESQTQGSAAFVELQSGEYEVTAWVEGPLGRELVFPTDTVVVESVTLTSEAFVLAREPLRWSFLVEGTGTCDELSLSLEYADPDDALAESEDDDVELYREGLRTDQGLPLDGEAVPCTSVGLRQDVVLDPGRYRLLIERDGGDCARDITLGGAPLTGVIDVSPEACGGS